jgi:hypothetical protein
MAQAATHLRPAIAGELERRRTRLPALLAPPPDPNVFALFDPLWGAKTKTAVDFYEHRDYIGRASPLAGSMHCSSDSITGPAAHGQF